MTDRTSIRWTIPLLLFLLLFVFSYRYLTMWFMIDDMALIHAAASKSTFKMLFDRETYLTLYKFYYTPLFPLPFKIDWAIFKLNPTGYHVHNMIAVFLTALAGYRVLRLYVPALNAWIGTFLFAISYPNIANIGWITMKHYIWGTFLILLSFYIFKKAEKLKSYVLYGISLISFFAAILMKEAFAPMPAAIFLLSSGNLKDRISKSFPFFSVLGLYFLLRYYFIGGMGGYLYIQTAKFDLFNMFIHSYKNISFAIAVIWGSSWIFIAVILLFVIINPKKSWVFVALFLIWMSPFMLISAPHNDFGIFYFPPKLTLPLFALSAMAAYSSANVGVRRKFIGYGLVTVLFFMQILNLYRADGYIKNTSAHYKDISAEMRQRLKSGNVFIVDNDFPQFFSPYYELLRLSKDDLKGVLAVTNLYGIPFMEPYLKNSRFVYLNRTWFDTNNQSLAPSPISDGSPPPDVVVRYDPPFVEGRITDSSKSEFIIANLNVISESNILCQAFKVPPFINIRAGLKKKEEVYVYRKTGDVFSRPYMIKLPD